ncbi:hypothetical protein T265_12246 [Opisthorchis viverrini]|uniref:Uncharacterized protein n=1 Tax=Opisthorchis viverrini TaxID=6198 RepID=A0A074Z5D5_OPIVI|nr:hypothetical protein T265_12246 [Opisthorchis viverrini]KER18520.1 hypothetical protein T265_12246 [Opisthorchis viverrini]
MPDVWPDSLNPEDLYATRSQSQGQMSSRHIGSELLWEMLLARGQVFIKRFYYTHVVVDGDETCFHRMDYQLQTSRILEPTRHRGRDAFHWLIIGRKSAFIESKLWDFGSNDCKGI